MRRRSPVTRSLLDMRNGESPGVYNNFCIWRSLAATPDDDLRDVQPGSIFLSTNIQGSSELNLRLALSSCRSLLLLECRPGGVSTQCSQFTKAQSQLFQWKPEDGWVRFL